MVGSRYLWLNTMCFLHDTKSSYQVVGLVVGDKSVPVPVSLRALNCKDLMSDVTAPAVYRVDRVRPNQNYSNTTPNNPGYGSLNDPRWKRSDQLIFSWVLDPSLQFQRLFDNSHYTWPVTDNIIIVFFALTWVKSPRYDSSSHSSISNVCSRICSICHSFNWVLRSDQSIESKDRSTTDRPIIHPIALLCSVHHMIFRCIVAIYECTSLWTEPVREKK